MALPFFFGGLAAIIGANRKSSSFYSADKKSEEDQLLEEAKTLLEDVEEAFTVSCDATLARMNALGDWELRSLSGFAAFAEKMEEIQDRPELQLSDRFGMDLPEYDAGKLKQVAAGAALLRERIDSASRVFAGRIAADGAVSMSLKAAGTDAEAFLKQVLDEEESLKGIGAQNPEGLSYVLPEEGERAKAMAEQIDKEVSRICEFLDSLYRWANLYSMSLESVNRECRKRGELLAPLLEGEDLCWGAFSEEEQRAVEELTALISVLYKLCRVKLVSRQMDGSRMSEVNSRQMQEAMDTARRILQRMEDQEKFEGEQVQAKLI